MSNVRRRSARENDGLVPADPDLVEPDESGEIPLTQEDYDLEALGFAPDGSRMHMGDETWSGAPWHPHKDPSAL